MSSRLSNTSIAVSLKPYLQRVLLVSLFAVALLLVHAERQQKDWAQMLRMMMLEVTTPIANALASPAAAIEALGEEWNHFWFTHAQNRQLRYENAELMRWRDVALKLEAENNALRDLMQYEPPAAPNFVTAKAIGATVGSLSQHLKLNAGLEDGLRRNLPVINEAGLLGRVLHVSPNHSEVLLLTDMRSRIPVVLEPSGERAILMGDHHGLPYLKMANPKAQPPLGEVVMTSDDGGVMPAGLYVGKLFAARDDKLKVRPAFQASEMDFVRILDSRKR